MRFKRLNANKKNQIKFTWNEVIKRQEQKINIFYKMKNRLHFCCDTTTKLWNYIACLFWNTENFSHIPIWPMNKRLKLMPLSLQWLKRVKLLRISQIGFSNFVFFLRNSYFYLLFCCLFLFIVLLFYFLFYSYLVSFLFINLLFYCLFYFIFYLISYFIFISFHFYLLICCFIFIYFRFVVVYFQITSNFWKNK